MSAVARVRLINGYTTNLLKTICILLFKQIADFLIKFNCCLCDYRFKSRFRRSRFGEFDTDSSDANGSVER